MTRRPRGIWTTLLGSLATLTLAGAVHAQTRDPAAATELFEKGRSAMKIQDYTTACAAFADSHRFDAKVGTLLNLADCEEHVGRLVSARSHWQQAIDLAHANHDARENVAKQRFAALDPRVAKLSVKLVPGAPAGVVVRRDDVDLGEGSLGVALPVDPGPHAIVVSADGYESKTTTIQLAEGQLMDAVVEPGPRVAPPPPAPLPAPVVPTKPAPTWSTQKTLATIGFGLAAAGVATGSVFGWMAKSANDASLVGGACDPSGACSTQGLSNRDDAVRDGNISTVAFIAGGAFLVSGIVLWLTAPSHPSSQDTGPTTSFVVLPGGAGVRGGF